VFGDQDHAALDAELAATDQPRPVDGLDRPEGNRQSGDIRHSLEELVREIDDFLEGLHHRSATPSRWSHEPAALLACAQSFD
jgi:hypothetical protein